MLGTHCVCASRRNPDETVASADRIVVVDLADGTTEEEPLTEEMLREWLGGRGLGVWLLARLNRWGFDEVPIVLARGPLAGFDVAAGARCSLISRSPKTGTVFDSSAGGALASRLAACNIAALIIHSRAKRPSILEVTPKEIRLLDARDVWNETVDSIGRSPGKGVSFAGIGPAALAGVSFSCVMVDTHHAFGRGGLGRLFAARNLKAVVVRAPIETRAPADPERFGRAVSAIKHLLVASPPVKALSAFGTPFLVAITNWLGILPGFNFTKTRMKQAEALYADVTTKDAGRGACARCPIACKRRTQGTALPEYETVGMLGANCGVFDYEAIKRANLLANRYGVDTISAGGALAAFYETVGRWPSADEFLKDFEALISGEHEASGGAEVFGGAGVAVRGLELPAYDPRGSWGMGLAYATSTRGGCHLRGYMVAPEILRKPRPLERFTFAGKPEYLTVLQNRSAVADALGVCKFAFLGATEEEYAEAVSAATGVEITAEDLMESGRRIYQLERLINEKLGRGREHDTLPARFFREKVADLAPLPKEKFEDALRRWRSLRDE